MNNIKLFEYYIQKESNQNIESLIDTVMNFYKDGILNKPLIKDKTLNWLFDQMINLCKELRFYRINSTDFLNTNNWGVKKDGSLGVFDIGFGDYFDDFDDANKPKNLEISDVEETGLLKNILSKYDIKEATLLGSGLFGHAHDIGNNRVLKITKDKTEAINSKRIEGKKLKHVADIYNVDYFERSGKTYYVIILEKLKISDKLVTDYEVLKIYFDDLRNQHLDIDVITKISKKHRLIGEFLNDILNLGHIESWDKWRDILVDKKELTDKYDFNDISEIVSWIKNSKYNNNSIDTAPPQYIVDLVNDLIK